MRVSSFPGFADEGFGAVADAFVDNFRRGTEVGAACAVYHRGRLVVDLLGGVVDDVTRRPWTADTITVGFSISKGLMALVRLPRPAAWFAGLRRSGRDGVARVRRERQAGHRDSRRVRTQGRPDGGGRESFADRRAGVGPRDPRARGAASAVGAWHGIRLPRADLRVAHRRDPSPCNRDDAPRATGRLPRRRARGERLDRAARRPGAPRREDARPALARHADRLPRHARGASAHG